MFNKSKLMKRAHAIRKATSCTMSEALRTAWIEAKRLQWINDRLFDLEMIDRRNDEDRAEASRLRMERTALNAKLNPRSAEALAEQERRNRQILSAWQEAEEIRFELGQIMRSRNPDMAKYDNLRTRLKEIA